MPISLKDGENSFIIATVDGKIYTWLNEELIDICKADASMPVSGGLDEGNGKNPEGTQNESSIQTPDVEKTEQPTVKLNAKSLPLQVKKSTNVLKASGMIAGDKVKSWKSSKTSVATVSKSGKITAKKVGTAIITVTTVKGATASHNPLCVRDYGELMHFLETSVPQTGDFLWNYISASEQITKLAELLHLSRKLI